MPTVVTGVRLIKGCVMPVVMVLGSLCLTACDRSSTTSAMSNTAPTSPTQLSSKRTTTVIDDTNYLNTPPPLPTASETASIITHNTSLTGYQYAYMAIIQILDQDLTLVLHAHDPDVLFAQALIVHQQAAINMAKIQLEHGQDPVLRKLAEDLMLSQGNQIQILRHWLSKHPDSPKVTAQTKRIQQEFSNGLNDMHAQMMAGILDDNPDIAFAQSMLPHHKGALALAQVESKYGKDDSLRQLADNVIETQQDEIQVIQAWLAQQ